MVILVSRKALLLLYFLRVPLTRSAPYHPVFLHLDGFRSEGEPH
jgi:hypothetical protein